MNKLRFTDTKEFDWEPIIHMGIVTFNVEFLYDGISPLRKFET